MNIDGSTENYFVKSAQSQQSEGHFHQKPIRRKSLHENSFNRERPWDCANKIGQEPTENAGDRATSCPSAKETRVTLNLAPAETTRLAIKPTLSLQPVEKFVSYTFRSKITGDNSRREVVVADN